MLAEICEIWLKILKGPEFPRSPLNMIWICVITGLRATVVHMCAI
jgi:hypothetical protein